MFRDVTDLEFFTQEGVEYVRTADGSVFVREDCIPELTLQTTTVVIGAEGYAQYFNIGIEVEGKTLEVDLPPGAAFAVYDAAGECVEYSTISGKSSAVLPAQGRFVLVGGARDTFILQYKYGAEHSICSLNCSSRHRRHDGVGFFVL